MTRSEGTGRVVRSSEDSLRQFQLYLLSRMRPAPVVDAALRTLGASVGEMREAAERCVEAGIEEMGVGADAFERLIGRPVSSAAVRDPSLPGGLRDSRALRFRLPLWQAFDFALNEHASGFVWGLAFERRAKAATAPTIRTLLDLQPWTLLSQEFLSQLPAARREDSWGTFVDLSVALPTLEGGPSREIVVGFDFGLLHCVTLL